MKKLLNKLILLKRTLAPRYRLTLDTYGLDLSKKKIIYKLKLFSEFAPIDLSYDEILKNEQYLYSLNPHDLVKIASIEKDINSNQTALTELLRHNTFKIKDEAWEAILTGDEICRNPLLIERMRKMDIYRVSYSTGFNHGRDLSKELEHSKIKELKIPDKPKL